MINPQILPFLAEWDKQWASLPNGATPAMRRAHFEIVARNMRLATPEGIIEKQHIANGVRVLEHSRETNDMLPALIYMHGGAYMQGSPETHYDITTRLAAWANYRVFSVDYALAPENPFPAAIHNVRNVVEWLFTHADNLNVQHDKIVIGGDSAGANLAAASCLHFRGTKFTLKGQLLVYPGLDNRTNRPSHVENANGPIITVAGMPTVLRNYCPDEAMLTNEQVSPIYAKSLSDLPPAFVCIAEHDPLRDEGRDYGKMMQKAGVNCTIDEGDGLIHGYLRAMDYCDASMNNLKKMAEWLKRA
jgi:acetyl esterase